MRKQMQRSERKLPLTTCTCRAKPGYHRFRKASLASPSSCSTSSGTRPVSITTSTSPAAASTVRHGSARPDVHCPVTDERAYRMCRQGTPHPALCLAPGLCVYEWAHHAHMASEPGVCEDGIRSMADKKVSALERPRMRVAAGCRRSIACHKSAQFRVQQRP